MLINAPTDTRVVYFQAILATCAGYVYCLIFFLGGGRLLPTVLLHSVNNIASSFYHYSPHSRSHSSRGEHSDNDSNKRSGSAHVSRLDAVVVDASIKTAATGAECSQVTTKPIPPAKTATLDTTSVGTGVSPMLNLSPELCRVHTSTSTRFPVDADARVAVPWVTSCGFIATAVAHCMAGRACSNRLHKLNRGSGGTGPKNVGCSALGPSAISSPTS